MCHNGEIAKGHYIIYLRYRYHDSDHWVLYDADKQIQVIEEVVLKQAQGVYQLFYERDDKWRFSKAYDLIDISIK